MALFGVNLNPPARQLRQFAAIFLVFFGLAGAWALRKWGSVPVASAIWSVALVGGVAGLVRPPWIRPVYVALTLVTWPIGWVVSILLLGVVYFGVVTPLGLVMRLFGRDPLARRFDPVAKTYWSPREQAADVDRYFRQF